MRIKKDLKTILQNQTNMRMIHSQSNTFKINIIPYSLILLGLQTLNPNNFPLNPLQ